MKKSIRILALALVAVMLCLALTACGKTISGTYEPVVVKDGGILDSIAGAISDATDSSLTYTFSGSKVTVEVTAFGKVESFEGKYSIKDGKITLEFENEDAEDYNGTFTFEELDSGNIKIGSVEYRPVEK